MYFPRTTPCSTTIVRIIHVIERASAEGHYAASGSSCFRLVAWRLSRRSSAIWSAMAKDSHLQSPLMQWSDAASVLEILDNWIGHDKFFKNVQVSWDSASCSTKPKQQVLSKKFSVGPIQQFRHSLSCFIISRKETVLSLTLDGILIGLQASTPSYSHNTTVCFECNSCAHEHATVSYAHERTLS